MIFRDQVEIITSQNQLPTMDWLSFVKTGKARHWIKKYLKEEQFAQTLEIGKEILTKFLKKHKLTEKSKEIVDIIPKLGFTNLESIIISIGRGELVVESIARKLFPTEEASTEEKQNFFSKYLKKSRNTSGIKIQGMNNLLISFAKCCHPVPGDSIAGYLTKGRGVTVHRVDCKNMIHLLEDTQRIIEAEWDIEKNQEFLVHLLIIGEDRKDFLKDVTLCVSKLNVNIVMANFSIEDMYAKGYLNLQVKDLQHLTRIINSLQKLQGVISVERFNEQNSNLN